MTEAWSSIIVAAIAVLFWFVGRPDKKKEIK
jgi:hypothetical protein